jgi:hypothetical protein
MRYTAVKVSVASKGHSKMMSIVILGSLRYETIVDSLPGIITLGLVLGIATSFLLMFYEDRRGAKFGNPIDKSLRNQFASNTGMAIGFAIAVIFYLLRLTRVI